MTRIALLMVCAALMAPAALAQSNDLRGAVLKVYANKRTVELSRPWSRTNERMSIGSATLIGDRRALTSAHVVSYARDIFVQSDQSSRRHRAVVSAMSPEMDLAILEIQDASFPDDLPAVEIAEQTPAVRTSVQMYGYPQGGAALAVTGGIISRMEYASYHYGESGLRVQVDAGINPGNSGGPAIYDNKLVGVVYSRLRAGDNIGYLIPAEEIGLFLDDIEDGEYDGKARFLDSLHTLTSPTLRSVFNLDPSLTGVLVNEPYLDDESYPLKEDDIILQIGDYPVDNAGQVRVRDDLKLQLNYVVALESEDGTAPVEILRDGMKRKLDAKVFHGPDRVIDYLRGERPSYFIYGPLVFSPATADFLDTLEAGFASGNARTRAGSVALYRKMLIQANPLLTRRADRHQFPDEELVMVAARIPHPSLEGFDNPFALVVSKVNGQKVRNLRHMVEILRDTDEQFVTFDFAGRKVSSVVFDRQQIDKITREVMADRQIVDRASPDVEEVWSSQKITIVEP